MIEVYKQIVATRFNAIMTLGLAYAATIVFTFFGPVLTATADKPGFLSLIAVLSHVAAFYFKPFKWEMRPWYFPVCFILLLPMILLFSRLPWNLQLAVVSAYAFFIGRIGSFWTLVVGPTVQSDARGRMICTSLFISFLLLYLVNVCLPMLDPGYATLIPALISGGAVLFYRRMAPAKPFRTGRESKNAVPDIGNKPFMGLLVIVYIAGGFSYAGIYPHFMPYAHIDRYFNVLFFMAGLISAGMVLDHLGRKIAFSLGVGFLGISFTFFIMPLTLATYLLCQTFLQMGWAFVNAFGWSFSWDMAAEFNTPQLFSRGISAMLFGAGTGAALLEILVIMDVQHKSIYGAFTFIPLFLVIVWLSFFSETLKNTAQPPEYQIRDLDHLPSLSILTLREKEVCCICSTV